MENIDLDGYYSGYNTFFDIKILADNVTRILEGIYQDLYQRFSTHKFLIRAEHSKLIPIKVIKEKRQQIQQELIQSLPCNQYETYIRSSVLPGVSFRLIHSHQSFLVTEDSYNPYHHAKNSYQIALQHFKKYVKESPFFLVFVVCPWFNSVIGYFPRDNYHFYRAFSRRVFMQYMNRGDKFKDAFPHLNFEGDNTVHEVTQHLSGILFLEDHSIENTEIKGETKISGYMFLNPDAKNTVSSLFRNYLVYLENMSIEDFKYDTY